MIISAAEGNCRHHRPHFRKSPTTGREPLAQRVPSLYGVYALISAIIRLASGTEGLLHIIASIVRQHWTDASGDDKRSYGVARVS